MCITLRPSICITILFGNIGLGVFSEKSISRDPRELRDSRVSREFSDCGKERRFRPFSRDSRKFRDFRDSRDFSSEKTPFVMTPFSGPDFLECRKGHLLVEKGS